MAETAKQDPLSRVQLGTVTWMYSQLPWEEALDHVAAAGFRYAGISGTHQGYELMHPGWNFYPLNQLKEAYAKRGLTPIATNNYPGGMGFMGQPRTPWGFMRCMDLLQWVGVKQAVLFGPMRCKKGIEVIYTDEEYAPIKEEFYQALGPALDYAKKLDMPILVKPHGGIARTAQDALEAVQKVNSPYFQVCWDPGNVAVYAGVKNDPDFPQLAPHVKMISIKDYQGEWLKGQMALPGEGEIDFVAIFREVLKHGFSGPAVVESIGGSYQADGVSVQEIDQRLIRTRENMEAALREAAEGL